MNIISDALAAGVSQLAEWRVKIFKSGLISQHRLKVAVVSIGNLTFGGTGKTPITQYLVQLFLKKGHRPGVACRSYKAESETLQKIVPAADDPRYVGDEPYLLAKSLPNVPVYSGPLKWKAAEALCQNENIDMVFLDDGFQHLKLFRDLDILLLDASEEPNHYSCFPLGRAREPFSARARAQIYFLTKCNLAAPANLKFHRDSLAGKKVYEFNYEISGLVNLSETQRLGWGEVPGHKVLAVTALARPEAFHKLILERSPRLDLQVLNFRDHHHFSESDVKSITEKFRGEKFDSILITEKDGVKLRRIKSAFELPIWQVGLQLRGLFNDEELYEEIYSFLA